MDVESRSATSTPAGAKRTQIVFADDSPASRNSIVGYLRTLTNVSLVTVCEEGQAAIEATLRHQPDVLLLDAQMPVMDGYEAARIVRSCMPGTAIIMTSVNDTHEVRARCAANGADAFVSKTQFDLEFSKALEKALLAASADSRYREHEIRSNHKFKGAPLLASAGCLAIP